MRIGAHVSIAGGIETAIDRAVQIGVECVQIFGGPPRSFRAGQYSDQQAKLFRQQAKTDGIVPTWLHGIYLINLASPNPDLVRKSINSLVSYMELCHRIGGAGVLFHVGSHGGNGLEAVRSQIVSALAEILQRSPHEALLCLENSAGQGGSIGATFAELQLLIEAVDHPRLGVCLDTQHAFAAGYDMSSRDGVSRTFNEIDTAVGLEALKVVHCNDSKASLGSHLDRHENIGQGQIGLTGFEAILAHPAVRNLPLLLEVPGDNGTSGPDAANIGRLKRIRDMLA